MALPVNEFVPSNNEPFIDILPLLADINGQPTEVAVRGLMVAMHCKDPDICLHCVRSHILMERVAERLKIFDRIPKEILRLGCLLHDLGKLCIPNSILNKPGRLSTREYEIMKTHPIIGYEMLLPLNPGEVVLGLVRHHHERMDGTGYPDRLTAVDIPDYVSVFAACDCFDALTSLRPYRPAMSFRDALKVLRKDALAEKLDWAAVSAIEAIYG